MVWVWSAVFSGVFCIDVCLALRFCALFDLSLDKIVLRPAINVLRKI